VAALDVPVPHRVVDRVEETHDVTTLWVQPEHGPLAEFEPAQFSMIGVVGVGEAPISISSPATNRAAHAYTIRAAGAVTQRLVACDVGDIVTIRGPMGRPWDLRAGHGRDLVFVAGGIGIAPLRAAIHAAVDGRRRFGPERHGRISVLVGATSPENMVYRSWLEAMSADGVDVRLTVDRLGPSPADWSHEVGLVTALLDDIASDSVAFLCGPDPMMTATIDRLAGAGVPLDRIQVTLERNMYCGHGTCGHCQLGRLIVCRDGPVVTAAVLGDALGIREL
jgi:NAD(P)H-flavin reductase